MALADEGALARTNLVTLDYLGEGSMRTRLDPICQSFAKRLFLKHGGELDIVGDMVKPSPPTKLGAQDQVHVKDRLQICTAYLLSAQQTRMHGANILIYGVPGTGKTEFARHLVQQMSGEMLEVGVGNAKGNSVPPHVRFGYYKLAQGLLSNRTATVLFDECEEVLSSEMVKTYANGDQNLGHKSWANCLLETNQTPTIWIANAINEFDPALIRRFDVVIEMPYPTQSQRQQMLTNLCEGVISERLIGQIAASKGSTPAMLAQTARVLKAVAKGQGEGEMEALACTLVNDRFSAQGLRAIAGTQGSRLKIDFDPAFINSTIPLQDLSEGFKQSGRGRICLYGPSGTGKTAFGKWLSRRMGLPSHFYKASDLLAPCVGETERNIAKAFMRATTEGAVLQIDEVDSFLQDRSTAKQNWEISLVNEMLTQLEGFDGVFVASTNRFEQMDSAVLRRFDVSLKFDYLMGDSAWIMFQCACQLLGLHAEPSDKPAIARLQKLTPGDFDQVLRQTMYRKVQTASDLTASLHEVSKLKAGGAGQTMGFLH
jgi:AAA+ superfamily predicted ATPase